MKSDAANRQAYYANMQVRARLHEFFDGAAYFLPAAVSHPHYGEQFSVGTIGGGMAEGEELNRSLWDRKSLLAHLDIEYVNFDVPFEAYTNPLRAFELQDPVRHTIRRVLCRYGIRPLEVMTGRGYHFVWRIRQDSPAFEQLASLGRMSKSLEQLYARNPGPDGEPVSPRLGNAFAGMGMLTEYLAHSIISEASALTKIPIEMGAVEVGPGERGREMISLDITEYGDPLIARSVRAPFSVYLPPWQQPWLARGEELERMAPIFCVPTGGLSIAEALRLRSDAEAVKELAAQSSTVIPDFSANHEYLIHGYQASPLNQFHDWYYSSEHDPVEKWPETYDRTDLQVMPTCLQGAVTNPNDALLRPGWVRRLVRVLLSLGWHPRHIAGLLRSKYERDYGWGDQWFRCDPCTRADFYARVFAGLIMMRLDGLVDFNCQSAREEGLCGTSQCSGNLLLYRQSLIDRKRYERLAHSPFHGLYVPEPHS
jgi:hypothetical protein